MGLKRIKKPDGEIYFIDERGHRVFSTDIENLKDTISRNIPDEELQKKILLTTETNPIDLIINERLDVISAECVFSSDLFQDFFESDDNEIRSGTKSAQDALRNARQNVLRELRIEAINLKADAVIGVKLSYTEFYNKKKSMVLLLATGTAVKLK
ncbi:MAG TPA: heavy metal-binding domain-containing protein [Ignavibacteriaceae bacterium]|nr:heavy metal-binding domain-containing protein [Ignavibacteriaceae bacterium]